MRLNREKVTLKTGKGIIMILNQLVYVVINKKEERILGVFNDYDEAEAVAFEEIYEKDYDGREVSLTPILVDKVNDDPKSRKFCFGQREEDEATDAEMALVTDAEEVMATAPDSESFEGCGLEKDSEDMEEELTDEAIESEEDRAFRDFIDFLQAMIDP